MPRSRIARFQLRHQLSSNDSDDSSSSSSSSSTSSTSTSSNNSHNSSLSLASINSPPRSPGAISLHLFSDSDSDNEPSGIQPPSSNPSPNSSNSSIASSSGIAGRRGISLFASDSDGDDSDQAPPTAPATNSDASTNSSFDLSSAAAGGSSFGFSPQRSSFGVSGSDQDSPINISRNIFAPDSDDSDTDNDNDELNNRRDLFNALALIEPENEEQVLAPDSPPPPPPIVPRVPRSNPLPRPSEGLFNFSSILSNFRSHNPPRPPRRGVQVYQRRRSAVSPYSPRIDPEEEEDTEDEEEDLDVSVDVDLDLVELDLLGNFPSSRSLREEMSRVTGSAPAGGGQGTSGGGSGTAAPAVQTGPSMISYECSVCLENLDQPASIDLENNGDGGDGGNDAIAAEIERMLLFGPGGPRRGGGRGRGRGRLSQVNVLAPEAPGGRRRGVAAAPAPNPVNLTDVVATGCGHLYHQVCLEKWFTEQGRRSCPSCRKLVPKTKCFKLYPNISQDLGGRGVGQHNENAAPPQVPSVVVAGSSGGASGSNSASVSPGTSSGVSSANEGGGGGGGGAAPCINIGGGEDGGGGGGGDGGGECRKAECQDLKVIHNTLMNDYNELQERFNDLRENDELKEATIRSLQDDNEYKGNEIERLKRQMIEAPESQGRSVASSSGSAPKRRRK